MINAQSGLMLNELDVLQLVSERLSRAQVQFMLTGSFALAYYATPRMTRDLDIVVDLRESDIDRLSRDIQSLVHATLDKAYLRQWAASLGVAAALEQVLA